jgi:hypothetical protein
MVSTPNGWLALPAESIVAPIIADPRRFRCLSWRDSVRFGEAALTSFSKSVSALRRPGHAAPSEGWSDH